MSLLPKVLVLHPGRQHSHQLAMALAERGMLAKYITGVPTRRDAGGWLARPLMRKTAETYAVPIDPSLVSHVYISSATRVAVRRLGSNSSVLGHMADGWFDRYVCRLLDRLRPDVVVAYENSALWTFRTAKRLGITTVLDAASVHHRWQDRFFPGREGSRFHRRVTRRKDEEVALADRIITVSQFARESYLEAGIPANRVQAVPVGVDVGRFQCRAVPDVETPGLRFVFVGNASPLKGVDVLMAAVRRLRAAGVPFSLTLIGGVAEAVRDDDVNRLPWMSHDRLPAELSRHDVLVLPSFFDSFGMVVAEAMACGLPVIVTDNVGSKEMIAPEVNGLMISPGDPQTLADAMNWFLNHRERLPQMSKSARESAERYDWAVYRRRVTELLASL